jgi:DGQHR domain-containing protein
MIEVKVVKLKQKGIDLFIGKMKVKDILSIVDIEEAEEDQIKGYQRVKYEERIKEIGKYLIGKSKIIVFPSSIVLSLREPIVQLILSKDGETGILKIPRKKGAAWIVDGQHRIGGFEILVKLAESIKGGLEIEKLPELLEFELPVSFLYLVKKEQPQDIERAIFFLVNKTQKGIRPSLKDYLMHIIATRNTFWHPILDAEKWRIDATGLVLRLHRDPESKLMGLINITGARGMKRPLQLSSFVSALEPLMKNKNFMDLSDEEKFTFLKRFWDVLHEMHSEAFIPPYNSLLLKNISVYALMELANDVFNYCKGDLSKQKIKECIKPLSDPKLFDKEKSPYAAFGGRKGAHAAYEILKQRCPLLRSVK